MGSMYDEGLGVPENDAEAVKWCRKAAEQGYAPAQYNLGPLLQRRKARLTEGFPVTRFMLFEQAIAYQKPDATFAHFDRRDHGLAPREALAEPLPLSRGWRFSDHVNN